MKNTRTNRTKHPLYWTWHGMRQRCRDKNCSTAKHYVLKGITVCDRWLEPCGRGFYNFLEDMGDKPSPKHTLDRIDPEKGYSPENCRWVNVYTQNWNRSNIGDYPGVSYNKKQNRYYVSLSINGKYVLHTSRAKREDAIALRKEYEIKYGLRN